MEKQTTENLLEQSAGKPAGLPDKFWDEASSSVKLKELIADYNYMASRDENLVETNLRGVPARFEDYQIQSPSPVLELDDDIRRRFFEKHFTTSRHSWFMIWRPKGYCRFWEKWASILRPSASWKNWRPILEAKKSSMRFRARFPLGQNKMSALKFTMLWPPRRTASLLYIK